MCIRDSSPTEWPDLWKEIPLYSDNNNVDDTVELINYPNEISALCGKSATGDDRTKMNWYGKICEGDKIQWNRMESTKNLKAGATKTGCRWVRTQGSSSWQQEWVGGCGVTPTNVTGLPMTESAEKQHNEANPICWRRMPTGCTNNLGETTENETIAPNVNHDTGWFIDQGSPTTAKCTERISSFNNYCVKDDAQTQWTGSKPITISHGWELPYPRVYCDGGKTHWIANQVNAGTFTRAGGEAAQKCKIPADLEAWYNSKLE